MMAATPTSAQQRYDEALGRTTARSHALAQRAGRMDEVATQIRRWLGEGAPAAPPRRPRGAHALRVLVAEDDHDLGPSVAQALGAAGASVRLVTRAAEAEAALAEEPFDVLVADVDLGDGLGTEVAERARASRPELLVVVTSGIVPQHLAAVAQKLGAVAGLSKPFSTRALLDAVFAAPLVAAPLVDGPTESR